MSKVEEFCGWFMASVDKVSHFFDGFGDLILKIVLVCTVFLLFYFLSPRWYQKILKWDTGLVIVTHLAWWLRTKF